MDNLLLLIDLSSIMQTMAFNNPTLLWMSGVLLIVESFKRCEVIPSDYLDKLELG